MNPLGLLIQSMEPIIIYEAFHLWQFQWHLFTKRKFVLESFIIPYLTSFIQLVLVTALFWMANAFVAVKLRSLVMLALDTKCHSFVSNGIENGISSKSQLLHQLLKGMKSHCLSRINNNNKINHFHIVSSFLSCVINRFRSFGSCCISLSFLARGTLDGYQMNELYVWDIAAAVLLIREAGGYCCKPDGSPIDLKDPRIIAAATQKLCDEMVKVNKEALGLWYEREHRTYTFFWSFSLSFWIKSCNTIDNVNLECCNLHLVAFDVLGIPSVALVAFAFQHEVALQFTNEIFNIF